MYYPSIEEVKQYKTDYKAIPICRKIYSDFYTPLQVLKKLKAVSHHCYMLESVEDSRVWGRYTFLGYDPKLELTCKDYVVTIDNGTKFQIETKKPAKYIEQILEEYKSPKIKGMPSFTGGLTGYFSYDYLKYQEPTLMLDAKDEEGFNDFDLMLFDKVIAFDNLEQQIYFIANMKTDRIEENYEKAKLEIDNMIHLVKHGVEKEEEPLKVKTEFKPLFNQEEFCNMVNKAKNYIYEGDIFQVVLSNRMAAEVEGSLLDTYRVLRVINPSPYMFYFSSNDIEIAGASPETLVKLTDDTLYTFPLAGTRPRGKTEKEDKQLEEGLLADPKECAEHNMLVDLGRNDIGKISQFGSVNVEKYMNIERYSHVMHIGSTVQGTIREDKSALDAVGAILPAGTLSGAPKIRAAEIINELEDNKRGIYGGAIGYLDFTGNLDTCIAIRIAYKKNGKVFIRSGAGIVADSVPETEFQETLNKARAVVEAVKQSEGGLEA
jgi:anthranilate synthase component 1